MFPQGASEWYKYHGNLIERHGWEVVDLFFANKNNVCQWEWSGWNNREISVLNSWKGKED